MDRGISEASKRDILIWICKLKWRVEKRKKEEDEEEEEVERKQRIEWIASQSSPKNKEEECSELGDLSQWTWLQGSHPHTHTQNIIEFAGTDQMEKGAEWIGEFEFDFNENRSKERVGENENLVYSFALSFILFLLLLLLLLLFSLFSEWLQFYFSTSHGWIVPRHLNICEPCAIKKC